MLTNVLFDSFHMTHVSQLGKHGNQQIITRTFCTYDLVLSNWHMCDNCMPKKPIIENKACL